MGAAQSTDDDNTLPWEEEALALVGFHVLKLKPNSPAELSGLNPYFDIILAVNGQTTFKTIQEFAQFISRYLDQEVTLSVLSLKTRSMRELKLYPRVGWSSNPKDGILGCSVRFSTVERALESAWRIMEINPQSPAERAGLQAYTDYVIGCEYRNLEQENDFYDLVHDHENKLLSLLVYNSVWNTCREVVIIPKSDWGGEGLLGCGVGYGLLHRIPVQSTPAPQDQDTITSEAAAPASSGHEKDGNSSPVKPTLSENLPTSLKDVSDTLRNPPNEIFPESSQTKDSPGAATVETPIEQTSTAAGEPPIEQTSTAAGEPPIEQTSTAAGEPSDISSGLAAVSLDSPAEDSSKDATA